MPEHSSHPLPPTTLATLLLGSGPVLYLLKHMQHPTSPFPESPNTGLPSPTFSMSRTLSCISRRAPNVSVSRSRDCSSSVSRWATKSSVRRGLSWG